MHRCAAVRAVAAAIGMLCCVAGGRPSRAAKSPASPPAPPDAVATAPAGTFHGYVENGTRTWRGIPYAESPIGPLRWKVTVPKAPLSAPLSTKTFGATCAQLGPGWPSMGGMIKNCHNYMHGCPNISWSNATSEDCLFMNVYAPAQARAREEPASLLPVVVRSAASFAVHIFFPGQICNSRALRCGCSGILPVGCV